VTYRGWDTSKEFLEKVVQEQGPFDGIMGFSQVHIHLDNVRQELFLSCSATDGGTSRCKQTSVMANHNICIAMNATHYYWWFILTHAVATYEANTPCCFREAPVHPQLLLYKDWVSCFR